MFAQTLDWVEKAALARLRQLLPELGLTPKEAKTRNVELAVGGEGVDFRGFHHRVVRSRGIPSWSAYELRRRGWLSVRVELDG